MPKSTRRELLAGSLAALGLASGLDRLWAALPDVSPLEPLPGGKFLGVVPFDAPAKVAFGSLDGEGLSGRRLLDLSQLTSAELITPTDQHFVRTVVPNMLPPADSWRVMVRTLASAPQELNLNDLQALSQPLGVHLCESADNGAAVGFGMMSAAEWGGVPIVQLLDRFGRPEGAFRVLVDGYDRHQTAIPDVRTGASWIFSPEDLAATGAFLAVTMNGEPLPPLHGAPVRLVVPGWFGCTWIKWVHSVIVVHEDSFATPHMREFAPRTHQAGRPKRASRFAPPQIDAAAMPIRVERWRMGKKVEYRVVGVRWGGGAPEDTVSLRFGTNEAWKPVSSFVPPKGLATWSFWSHRWAPAGPGTFPIELKVGVSQMRTRRLAAGHYTRRVTLASEV